MNNTTINKKINKNNNKALCKLEKIYGKEKYNSKTFQEKKGRRKHILFSLVLELRKMLGNKKK